MTYMYTRHRHEIRTRPSPSVKTWIARVAVPLNFSELCRCSKMLYSLVISDAGMLIYDHGSVLFHMKLSAPVILVLLVLPHTHNRHNPFSSDYIWRRTSSRGWRNLQKFGPETHSLRSWWPSHTHLGNRRPKKSSMCVLLVRPATCRKC